MRSDYESFRLCRESSMKSGQSKTTGGKEEFTIAGGKLLEKIKQLINEGNVRRIIIKNEAGQVMLEIPLTIAAVGTFLEPVLAAVGAMAALAY